MKYYFYLSHTIIKYVILIYKKIILELFKKFGGGKMRKAVLS